MKKIVIIAPAILILSLGIFLIKKHQDYKKFQKEMSLDFQKNADQVSTWIKEDKERIKEYTTDEIYRNSAVVLIKNQQESIVTKENFLETIKKDINEIDERSRIDFLSFVFNVFPKQISFYFK